MTLIGSAFAQSAEATASKQGFTVAEQLPGIADANLDVAAVQAAADETPAPKADAATDADTQKTLAAMQSQLDDSRKLLAQATIQIGMVQKGSSDQSSEIGELKLRLDAAEAKIEALDNVDSHQTFGFGLGDSIAMGGPGGNNLVAEANLRWIYARYDFGVGFGAGLKANLDIYNIIMVHPIMVGFEQYTSNATYAVPDFGTKRLDMTFGFGADVRLYKGLKLSGAVSWFVPNPATAYGKASDMVSAAKGSGSTNTGISQIDSASGGLSDVQAKVAAGADAASVVGTAYSEAMKHPRIDLKVMYWF